MLGYIVARARSRGGWRDGQEYLQHGAFSVEVESLVSPFSEISSNKKEMCLYFVPSDGGPKVGKGQMAFAQKTTTSRLIF